MRRFMTIILLAAALPAASGPAFAGDSSLSGNAAPAGGITGTTKTPHKHHAKSAKAVADDKAKADAAAGTAGTVIPAPKTDPAVNKLNTVLPP